MHAEAQGLADAGAGSQAGFHEVTAHHMMIALSPYRPSRPDRGEATRYDGSPRDYEDTAVF